MPRLIDADALESVAVKYQERHKNDLPLTRTEYKTIENFVFEWPSVNEWISVNDRLPEEKVWVLCLCRAGIHEVLRWQNGQWLHDLSPLAYMKSFVTHWMPLPQAPDADEACFDGKHKPEAPIIAGSKVYSGIWLCPRCLSELTKNTGTRDAFAGIPNYCPYCGQRLKLPNETVQVPEPPKE